MEKIDVLRAMLHGFDTSGFLTGGHKTLAGAANHVLGLKSANELDGKKRFCDVALAMSKAFTLCCTLDDAKAVREEVAFLQGVKAVSYTHLDVYKRQTQSGETADTLAALRHAQSLGMTHTLTVCNVSTLSLIHI